MLNEKTNDTDYKLYQAIINAANSCEEQSEIISNQAKKFELILFFYAHSFDKLYGLKPELEDLIWIRIQSKVYGHLIDYSNDNGIDNYLDIDINIGDFINKRAELYFSEVKKMKSIKYYFPAKLVYSIFESPLETHPSDNFDLAKEVKLESILAQPLSYLNTVAKKIIDFDLNFGNDLKYKEVINDLNANNTINFEALEIVITLTDECKKLFHPSEISGNLPHGREFIQAVKTIKKFKNSKNYLLLGSLIVFDKWVDSYTSKYKISKEHLLLTEHQILQGIQRINDIQII